MNERLLKNAPLADGGNYESNTKQRWAPAITSYFNRETTMTDQVEAVAAAVSKTAPLFLLVIVFQRQITGGLTTGAVKRLIPNEYLGD